MSESLVDVRRERAFDSDGRAGVLEAIRAIEAVEARQVIELAIVHLAALRRTEAELERLRRFSTACLAAATTPMPSLTYDSRSTSLSPMQRETRSSPRDSRPFTGR